MNLTRTLTCLLLLAVCALDARGDSKGLWLMPRKDACNTARADCLGNMKRAPRVVWSYGHDRKSYTFARPVRIGKRDAYFVQHLNGVQVVFPNGKILWNRPTLGVGEVADLLETDRPGAPVALVTLSKYALALLDATTGKTLWTWSVPAGCDLGNYRLLKRAKRAHLVVFPRNSTLGLCFEFSPSRRALKLLWQKDYAGKYWANLGPHLVLADMDNDGVEEIVLAGKPAYNGVIDLLTGAVKFDLKYEVPGHQDTGRPYGLLQAVDIDGDGYRDVVMASCQVEEYVSVLHNDAGKALSLVWTKFIGLDFPAEPVAFRPNDTSLADVNSDGKRELVFSLFNETGDGRWHTLVLDPMKGFDARLADLPDRRFWGCYDLNRDNRPEIVTSIEKAQEFDTPKTLQAVDGKTFEDIAKLEGVAPDFANCRVPDEISFIATRRSPAFLTLPDGSQGILISRSEKVFIWRLKAGRSVLIASDFSPLPRTMLCSDMPGLRRPLDLAIKGSYDDSRPAASSPLVAEAGGKRELILSLSDNSIIGGHLSPPLLAGEGQGGGTGRFVKPWTIRGSEPACWIGSDGRRVVCTATPDGNGISLFEPEKSAKPPHSFKTPHPVPPPNVSRSTFGLLPFGANALRLYIGFRPGAHAMTSGLYDETGKLLWNDPTNGPYPRVGAAADLNGDGAEEVVIDNHGRQIIYDPTGKSRLLAVGWDVTIPGRGDGAKYAVPVIGPFGPKGETRIIMAGGLDALEALDASGNRVAVEKTASCYDFEWCGPTVAKIRKDAWDVGTINSDGVFFCADAVTCKTRWTFPTGVRVSGAYNVSSADVDGDGRDNFLVGLPDGRLLALDEKDGKGSVLWQARFEAAVKDAIPADVDGDGLVEIVVELENGVVEVLR